MEVRAQKLLELEHYNQTVGVNGSTGFKEIQDIYALNNYFIPHQYESSVGCGSCQNRVKTRIFGWFESEGKAELEKYKSEHPEEFEV